MDRDIPVRMALIATYSEISKQFKKLAKERKDIAAVDVYASFDDAIRAARKMEKNLDVIISRGGTADFISRNVSIPVVFIPITPFDIVLALHRLPPGAKDIALSYFDSPIYGIDEIQKIYGVRFHEYTFRDGADIENNVEDMHTRGLAYLIGGEVAVDLAAKYGITGINLSAGADTVSRAVNEGVSIVRAARKERSRTARLAAAFNCITPGLVLTDEDNTVLVCNPAAHSLLAPEFSPVLGETFFRPKQKLHPKLEEAMTSRKPQQNYIRKIGGNYINTNHLPVFFDAKFIGFVHTYENVTKIQNLEQTIRKQLLDKGFVAKYTFDDIVTTDPVMAMVKETAASYAGSNSALLIEGESGTGKELFAQSLHNASRRRGGPFVAVNCAAIPANLLESELFGYEAGAFTGAKKEGRQGLFEVAHTGTIFLDEIGDLPKEFQARLLRVLQEKELMRVGGNRVIPVDVRIISATNKNLRELAREGFFREDLYYRLSVFSITVPPLRARKGDIMPLFRHFFREMGVTPDEETLKRFMPQLLGHSWPGNVRELQNIAERLAHAQQHLQGMDPARSHFTLGLSDSAKKGELAVTVDMERHESLKSAVEAVEWEIIDYLLKAHDKNYGEVAKRLGIGRTTLWRKYTRNEA